MAQPANQSTVSVHDQFVPRFVGGYVFTCAKTPEQRKVLVDLAAIDTDGAAIMAFFNSIIGRLAKDERDKFISWTTRMHLTKNGNVVSCATVSKAAVENRDDSVPEAIALYTIGPPSHASDCIDRCVHYLKTGQVVPTANYIAGQLAGSRGGLLNPRFIGFPYCAFPDKKAADDNAAMLEALMSIRDGGLEFFREIQDCMAGEEREKFAKWLKAAETNDQERVLMGLFQMEEGTRVLLLALGVVGEMDKFADRAIAHIEATM